MIPRRLQRLSGVLCLLVMLGAVGLLAGCSLFRGAEPWERDVLAKDSMKPTSLDTAIDDHIYFSKEASSGGRAYGGGGCGCN